MPQSFHVLRCYKCFTFQVDIVKKSNKWKCKLCGDKQSIKKVFCTGTGSECRSTAQELNRQRSMIAQQSQQKALEELNQHQENFNHSGMQGRHHDQHFAVDNQDWFDAQPPPFQPWGGSTQAQPPSSQHWGGSSQDTWEDSSANRWEAFLPTKPRPTRQAQSREAFSSQVQPKEAFLPTKPSSQVQSRETFSSQVQPKEAFLPTKPSSQVQSREAFSSQVQPREAFTSQAQSREDFSNQFQSREAFSNQFQSREAFSRQVQSREAFSSQVQPREAFSSQVQSREAFNSQVQSREAFSSQVQSTEAFCKQVQSRESFRNKVHFSEAFSNQVKSRDAFGNQIQSREAFSNQVHSREAYSNQVHSREALSNQVQSREAFSSQAQSREAFSNKPGNQIKSREEFIERVRSGEAFRPPKSTSQFQPRGGFNQVENLESNFTKRTYNEVVNQPNLQAGSTYNPHYFNTSQVFQNNSDLVKRQKVSPSSPGEPFSHISESTKKLLINDSKPLRQILPPIHEMSSKSILVNSESVPNTQDPRSVPPAVQSLSQKLYPTSTPDPSPPSQKIMTPDITPIEQAASPIEQAVSPKEQAVFPKLSPEGVNLHFEESSTKTVLNNSRWAKFLPPSSQE